MARAEADAEPAVPSLVLGDDGGPDALDRLIAQIQRAILGHPVAAQALFRALVAEGRRFAASADGHELAERIVDSPLVRRGRLLWDVATLRALDDDAEVDLPSALAEVFVNLTARDALEPLLSRYFELRLDDAER